LKYLWPPIEFPLDEIQRIEVWSSSPRRGNVVRVKVVSAPSIRRGDSYFSSLDPKVDELVQRLEQAGVTTTSR
jgi:hypothetical protein